MTQLTYLDLNRLQSVDSLPLRGASTTMIDMDKVVTHIREALRRGRYRGTDNPDQYLQEHGCVAYDGPDLLPTLAGILCFGRSPQAVLPKAVVDLGHYRGIDTLSYEVMHLEKDIGGTISDQLLRVEAYLWTNTHHGMTLAPGSLQRIEMHEYPQAVIRELIVNMLAHRDYTNFHAASRVFLFRNRIEWISPGGLPDNVTVEKLLSTQNARNPRVLAILFEGGYVEAIGQGLKTVVADLKRSEMATPQFEDTGSAFHVTVYGKAIDITAGIGIFANLSVSQRRILAFMRTRINAPAREIHRLFPARAERTTQRDLREMVELGFLTTSGHARSLQYHLAEEISSTSSFNQ
ncbi:ATP-binding protein [Candidatus Viridilinea mediisalina]|uniref:Uncharacterized protein n=1 Tax=Candidatus Viridilinea mediisalina TaxID=2024553 RepID=A0A2A6RGA1_9CHLR|nr:ATP-binding protein [Candidatus Viridilinea mediisalina]PDW01916.1 hypothetical protein CJ255_16615 [Candidatus Viridilinea mediisalina]